MPESFAIYPQNRLSRIVTALGTGFASYPITQPSITAPVGAVIDLKGNSLISLHPFCNNPAATSMNMRVVGYSRYVSTIDVTWYFPQVLASFSLTRTTGTTPSFDISGSITPMALVTLTASLLVNVLPKTYIGVAGSLEMASCVVDTMGSEFIQLQFQANADQQMGAFYRFV
jgi:hypothetical protein